ncbi:N-terminal binuclear Zn cluster-containing/DNA binding domain-containing protein [Rasamsonia emersonii CBS 393.64]|uniref:N-terminal binuclear Zn cluster-containing/DNA binding domain-containing protein n=1 Tax=Rasamsonia emersonii (strain ATCC 16479 / CBS 393.64 / IMI 116815) TaxID=1408163 RepID=A0A0F4YRL8_RASE3|nr:N-terminal binuclear Zn cluster-containing/DNA binding domain-containing protein [Rasamsonia emersonii CBS 393.64]KKA20894.1 N-terminal binuclear Zn cluster-containing/DNA binding domain-containing protein [Rasamsonia emersonii CBS 393.64]
MERLPPNRRRSKVPPEQRKRVSRACNGCNVRRIKCTGDKPCRQCRSAGRSCEYPSAAEERITISRATYEDLQASEQFLQKCLSAAIPSEKDRLELMRRVRTAHDPSPSQSGSATPLKNLNSSDSDEVLDGGRLLADPDGHRRYLGNSSGAAFLDQLREFASTVLPLVSHGDGCLGPSQMEDSFAALLGRYQTHDSRPLFLPQVDPYHLPSLTEAETLLSTLPSFDEQTNHTLRQAYSPQLLDGLSMRSSLLAILNAALAVASKQATATRTVGSEPSQSYFARAKLLLQNPLETATPAHIPCLSMMGYYLLGENRRDAAYSYIRLAGHIAITYGFHESWMTGEREKRQFWTVYVLDRFVSCLLGRPNMISDDDIGVDLPKDEPGLPCAEGLRAHVQLARIIGLAMSKIYGHRRGHVLGVSHIPAFLADLERWCSQLPPSLNVSRCSAQGANRDLLSLHMTYNQTIILLTRPLLFSAVKHAVARCFVPYPADPKKLPNEQLLSVCTTAAQKNAELFHHLWETIVSRDTSGLTMVDYHNSFNAALILELVRLRNPTAHVASTDDTNSVHITTITDVLRIAGQKAIIPNRQQQRQTLAVIMYGMKMKIKI